MVEFVVNVPAEVTLSSAASLCFSAHYFAAYSFCVLPDNYTLHGGKFNLDCEDFENWFVF